MATPDKTPSDILEAAGVKPLDEEALKDWPPKPEEKDKIDSATEDTESTEDPADSRSTELAEVRSVSSVTSVAEKASFLFFTAPWCEVSLDAAPRFAKLFAEFAERADFFQVDADRAPVGTERLNVRSVPAIVAFARGQEISRRVGLADQDKVERFAEDAVKEAEAGETDKAGADKDVPEKESAGEDKS